MDRTITKHAASDTFETNKEELNMNNTIEITRGMKLEGRLHDILVGLEEHNPKVNIDIDGYARGEYSFFEFTAVGGAVLDTLLSLEPRDYDVHTSEVIFDHIDESANPNTVVPETEEPILSDRRDALIENWAESKGLHIKEEEHFIYEDVLKNIRVGDVDFIISGSSDFALQDKGERNLLTYVNTFDIPQKMFTYSLEYGLQWTEEVEEAFRTKEFIREYADWGWLTDKEKVRLVDAKERYSEHLDRLVFRS